MLTTNVTAFYDKGLNSNKFILDENDQISDEATTPGTINRNGSPEIFCENFSKLTRKSLNSCEFCEVFKNTFFYRTPPVAACV